MFNHSDIKNLQKCYYALEFIFLIHCIYLRGTPHNLEIDADNEAIEYQW